MQKHVIFLYMNYVVLSFIFSLFLSASTQTDCIWEQRLTKEQILKLVKENPAIHIKVKEHFQAYTPELELDAVKSYQVQWEPQEDIGQKNKPTFLTTKEYNSRYVEYYKPQHLKDFLQEISKPMQEKGYKVDLIGKSLQGRDLFYLGPKTIDQEKDIIVMFGRHHGDEGTANWIIEGFMRSILNSESTFFQKYQLLLYPMINPDGAENMSRYNAKGRDLNREWAANASLSVDEVKIVQKHLFQLITPKLKKIRYVLDMHGSHREDFVYRVKKSFAGAEFYKNQQKFIDTLSRLDKWQKGNFKHSNGDPKMSRILFVRDYKINALTHETIKNIPLSANRDKKDLFSQGEALAKTLILLN